MEHAVAKSYYKIYNTLTAPCEKSKIISFGFSILKNIVAPSSQSRSLVKLIFWIAFVLPSSAFSWL